MPSKPPRHEWIDLFRGLAVIGMVETHASNTFLDSALQETSAYASLSYFHGLVAPSFFWIMGYLRGLTFFHSPKARPAWPAAKRLLQIMLVGYLMHLPWGLMSEPGFSTEAQWRMFMVDVLQCLGVSGLLLLAIERIRFPWVVAMGALFLVVAFADSATHWRTGFIPLDAYFTREHGSLFPLFPWAGFALAGFIISRWTVDKIGTAILGAALALGADYLPGIGATPAFFLERLGWIILLASATRFGMDPLLQKKRPWFGWLYLAGRESLVVYVVHLALIHAVPWPEGSLERTIGPTQPILNVALLFVGLLSASLLCGALNEWRKKARLSKPATALN
jgi:uncharacterized membrane protein